MPAKSFRALIGAVLKFPPSATVAASQVIHFGVSRGRARASIAGTIVSTASVVCGSALDDFSSDYRPLESFAELLPDDATLDIESSSKESHVLFKCGGLDLKLPLTKGAVLPRPKVPEPFFTATEETAKLLRWLASVAESDETKPDMHCVYLRHGAAIAGDQQCIVIINHKDLPDVDSPLPLCVCAQLKPGDKLANAENGLLVVSGCGVAQVPHLTQTLHFPLGVVDRLEAAKMSSYGRCDVAALRTVFKESSDCVARIPNVPACITLTFTDSGIHVLAKSDTASFHTSLSGKVDLAGKMLLELSKAEEALAGFDGGEIVCSQLLPKGEGLLAGGVVRAFFSPVHLTGAK